MKLSIVPAQYRLFCFLFAAISIGNLLCPAAVMGGSPIGSEKTVKTKSDKRPNILFFLSDDHRHDQLGCAGHSFLKTPTIDELAKRGTRFTHAYVTTSICAASRACIFTGLVERTHGYTFRTRPLAQKYVDQSYPVLMKQAGYQTGFVGKFGVNVPRNATAKMFDSFAPLNRSPYFKKQKDGTKRHVTEIAGDRAIEFIENASQSEKPFCLQVSFNAAHAEDSDKKDHFPWPVQENGLYDDQEIGPPRLSDPKIYEQHPEFLKNSFNRVRYFWRWDTPEKYAHNLRAYYRMITGLDRVMGRVLSRLDELGLDDNTVVIFSGDNGYYMAQRGFAGKWSHYDESLRVPLVIHDPRVESSQRGQTRSEISLNIDIPATILELGGVKPAKEIQGRSLVNMTQGLQPKKWRKDFFCEHLMHVPGKIPKWEGVHGQRYVYARYFEQDPVFEYLHDLKKDPDQLLNLATDPDFAELKTRLSKRCDELRDSYGGEYSLEKYPIN